MHLFLAPHYDDAVYSAGGLIAQQTRAGETVRVYTVMGGHPPERLPDSPIVRELHARWQAGADPVTLRRREDEAAIHRLDAEAAYNNAIPDCIYRTAHDGRVLYPDGAALFGPPDPDDPAVIALELRLHTARQLWQAIHFTEDGAAIFVPLLPGEVTLYAPLGVGNHVDHQIVRDWAFKLRQMYPDLTLMLYEDYPYIRDASAIVAALATLPAPVQAVPVLLDEEAVQAKIEAAALYASQLNTFWADAAALAADVRQTLARRGAGMPAEIVYRVA